MRAAPQTASTSRASRPQKRLEWDAVSSARKSLAATPARLSFRRMSDAGSIVVVGGGISGLAVAHALMRKGARVRLLEQGPRAGGVVNSVEENGFRVESGPNSLLDRESAMRELIDELGLSSRIERASPAANNRFVFVDGKLQQVPRAPPGFIATGLLSPLAKLRALGDLFHPRRSRSDFGSGDDSLHTFISRHFGQAVSRRLVDAMQTGIFAGDSERLSARAVFPSLVEAEAKTGSIVRGMIAQQRERRRGLPPGQKPQPVATYSFDRGLSVLTDALAQVLGEAVEVNARVERIARATGGWTVEWSREGQRQTTTSEHVILALPAYAAAQLVRDTDAALASELSTIPFASVSAVHLGFRDADVAQVPTGFGVVIPEVEKRGVLGIIFTSSVFPSRAPAGHRLFTTLVGGARHPERAQQTPEQLIAHVRAELRAILGITAEPVFARAFRWDRAIPQYNVGHLARLERIDARVRELRGLHLTGYSYRGIGLNDCVRDARRIAAALS